MTVPAPARPGHPLTDGMREFLESHMYLTLATRNPDGTLHVVPVAYRFVDGRFQVATSSSTRKARNLAARPDVTVTVDDRTTIGWVSAVGTAELVTGPASRAMNRALYRLWMTDEGLDVVGGLMHEVEDVTLVITPHRWLSWDWQTGFVADLEAAGISMADPARWFRV